jgi:hypothetical protein
MANVRSEFVVFCEACDGPLSKAEEHWPWLHDGCAVQPVANGPPA